MLDEADRKMGDVDANPLALEPFSNSYCDKPLEFQPGEKWNYSNSGYILLGYLIEKISGQAYSRFVQENIFTPLGNERLGL
jgi:CubicO group peptidase (beta-lactamase class C family)